MNYTTLSKANNLAAQIKKVDQYLESLKYAHKEKHYEDADIKIGMATIPMPALAVREILEEEMKKTSKKLQELQDEFKDIHG